MTEDVNKTHEEVLKDRNTATKELFEHLTDQMSTQLVGFLLKKLAKEIGDGGGDVDLTDPSHMIALATMATVLYSRSMGGPGFKDQGPPSEDKDNKAYGFVDFAKAA